MIMNVNVNDISGFDSAAEEIRKVYAERDRLREENEDLKFTLENKEYAEKQTKQFTEDICAALGVRSDMSTRGSILSEISKLRKEHENLKYTIKKQEEFTEEAASILGVSPSDLSLSDILVALRKLKRCEELNDMNSEIITDLKDKCDKETGRRLEAERYISNTLSKICSALGIEYSTDTTIEYILDTIDDLRGKKGKYDDLLMANVRKAANKARHWDILVDSYGEGTVRSLLENIGIDVSGDKGNGLF